MFSEKWERYFMGMAQYVSTISKDPSTKVGAVIVNELKEIVGTGYNGFPRGVDDREDRLNDRPTKYALVVHAELNAIIQAGHRARGGTIYVWPPFGQPPCCSGCAKAIIQAGIKRVVGYTPEGTVERWSEDLAVARSLLEEAGVMMNYWSES
jgi:dCMP deaminase